MQRRPPRSTLFPSTTLFRSRGNLTTAVQLARRAAQLAPSDEATLRRLITVLDRHGDRAGALKAYEEFAEVLRSEEHTSELQSPCNLVCRLLLEKTKQTSSDI